MHIRPDEIGMFNSTRKAEAYQKAMQVKENVEEVVFELKDFDDISGIDFNNKSNGSVIVKEHEEDYSSGLHIKTTGSLEYNPDSGEVEKFEASQYKSMSGLPGWRGLVGCFISGEFTYEQKTIKTLMGKEKELYIEKSGGKTQKVYIDKATGDIDYKEYNYGFPSLINF